ncbi:MAG: GC-type dockerin domain-anchored protein [Phycisphaerales bacterium]
MKARALAMQSFCGLALLAGTVANAQDQRLEIEQHANVQMMIESMLHGLHMQTSDPDSAWETCSGGRLNITGSFNAQTWSAFGQGDVCGGVMTIDYFGDLTPTGEGYDSNAQGFGSILDEQWNSSIQGIWGANADGELLSLEYREVADDGGSLKPKWWVIAAEVIAGGLVGYAASGAGGIIDGATGAVNLSKAIDSVLADPGSPPAPPTADIVIEIDIPIEDDEIVITVLGTGEISGNRSNHIGFDGSWHVDPLTGVGEVIGTFTFGDSSSCYADLDGDGQLTVFDFLEFQNAFASGDATADCDGDGALSLFDFLCFQNAFSAGC